MDNRVSLRAEDRTGLVPDYGNFMDAPDEFIFVPLTTATPRIGMTGPVVHGGDTDPTPCADAA